MQIGGHSMGNLDKILVKNKILQQDDYKHKNNS